MRTATLLLSVVALMWVLDGELGAAGSSGSGKLTLGTKVFEFDVSRCYLEGDADAEDRITLYGTGETEDGKRFQVFVARIPVGGMLFHDISLQIAGGDVYEARRASNGQMWIGAAGEENAPLIVIDGSEVVAAARFSLNFEGDPTVEGWLEATCK